MLLHQNTKAHHGKKIKGFFDEHGNELDSLVMCESITIIFDDGSRLLLRTDWRGGECYISQRTQLE